MLPKDSKGPSPPEASSHLPKAFQGNSCAFRCRVVRRGIVSGLRRVFARGMSAVVLARDEIRWYSKGRTK